MSTVRCIIPFHILMLYKYVFMNFFGHFCTLPWWMCMLWFLSRDIIVLSKGFHSVISFIFSTNNARSDVLSGYVTHTVHSTAQQVAMHSILETPQMFSSSFDLRASIGGALWLRTLGPWVRIRLWLASRSSWWAPTSWNLYCKAHAN